VALACQFPVPGDKLSITAQHVGLAFPGNAMVIAAVDTARKNPGFRRKSQQYSRLDVFEFSAVPAKLTIYYTNIASDARRAKAAAGRVTLRSNPMVATATAASAAVIDTATGAKPSRAAWTPHKSGRCTRYAE
jgi:hypothetical protein